MAEYFQPEAATKNTWLFTSPVFCSYNLRQKLCSRGYLQAQGIDIVFQQLQFSFSFSDPVSQPCATFSYALPMSFPVYVRLENRNQKFKVNNSSKRKWENEKKKRRRYYVTLLCCLRSI